MKFEPGESIEVISTRKDRSAMDVDNGGKGWSVVEVTSIGLFVVTKDYEGEDLEHRFYPWAQIAYARVSG